ncbi:MAG: hypothetical protein US13_C0015G0001 [candidate division TM6 bacterium GW2011_GWE2_36_25]|nr:MAG: hypothetical protein US03_C0014G0001 [candidate division TM6 bacterium GW2011_GWF2_36_131]KKQ02517.1 MAG: hypothetical protein US13_C0015G0001 [candidate division TM6 bacterium GW2011_GWE2_36_25]KKQ19263.1 MAG: hypothetical protein US32_C0012G0001 [candidate division TM6 bacterium GW2011_GWA2_36_9]
MKRLLFLTLTFISIGTALIGKSIEKRIEYNEPINSDH